MTLWIKIAKNEIRLKTYKFRKNRKLFFIIIFALFLFWAIYVGPALFDIILPDLLKSFSSSLKTVLHPLIEYSFMIFFVIFIMYPLFMMYRKLEIGIKDIVLSAPAKAGDILFGEFIGQLPFYLLFILAIGPLGTSLMIQLNPELNYFHYIMFYLIIFALISFGLLIGTILTNWLEHRILQSKKTKRLGNSLFLLLPFIVILMVYSFHTIFTIFDYFKELKFLVNFIPSFWYSNMLLYFIDPSLTSGYFLNFWVYLLLIILVPIIISIITYKKAEMFYDLEYPIQDKSRFPKIEKIMIKIIKKITPSKYKTLVVTQFKEFIRKRENINRLIYLIGLNIVFAIFLYLSLPEPLLSINEISFQFGYFKIEVVNFNFLIMMILSWIGGFTYGVFMGIYVFINTKEILFIYKKSIRSVKTIIISFLYNMVIIIIISDIILTSIFSILFILDFLTALTFFITYLLTSLIILSQAIAIQSIKPLYKERGKFIYFNIYLIVFLQILSFLLALLIFVPNVHYSINYSEGLILTIFLYYAMSLGISFILVFIGIKFLSRVE